MQRIPQLMPPISVSLTKSLLRQVMAIAKKDQRPRAEVIRTLLTRGLQRKQS